jgi:hypothetical protein
VMLPAAWVAAGVVWLETCPAVEMLTRTTRAERRMHEVLATGRERLTTARSKLRRCLIGGFSPARSLTSVVGRGYVAA